MPSREWTVQRVCRTFVVLASLAFATSLITACGGGGSSSSDNASSSSTPTTASKATVLAADAGKICEVTLQGAKFTSSIPPLNCNGAINSATAFLDGSKSTAPAGQTLSYSWSFVSKPAGSTVTLQDANTVKPSFVPDKAGAYAVQLIVSANGVQSARSVALVMALDNSITNPDRTANPTAVVYHYHGGLSAQNCVGCHYTASGIESKPTSHISTSNACQTCHTTDGFTKIDFVDHKEVFGKCSDCHDGVTAIGKSATHIPTTQECSDCHDTTSFLTLVNGKFDHSNITEPCSACHNGVSAKGTNADTSPGGHPSISVECDACHTTTTFAAPFVNHNDPKVVVPGTCGSAGCHQDGAVYNDLQGNTVKIASKATAPNPHPPTGDITIACDACHNTTSFNLGGQFDHGVLARHPIACKSCHDGINATGKIAGHINTATNSDCSNCHNTTTFVGGFVDHTTDTTVLSSTCVSCHDGKHTRNPLDVSGNVILDAKGNPVVLPIPGSPTSPQKLLDIHAAVATTKDCGACHMAGGSFNLATVDHSGFGSVGAVTLPAGETCSICHDGAIATGKPTGHLATSQDCGACHDPQSDSWAGAGFDHSSLTIIGNASTPTCVSCHDGTAATGQSVTHVPSGGQDCLVCHGTGFSSFALPVFNHSVLTNKNNCVSCHDGRIHDGVTVIGKPVGHIPTSADCSLCHADTTNGPGINGTTSSGFYSAVPFVNVVHPPYTSGCSSCHNGAYDNTIYNAKHNPDDFHKTVGVNGWECSLCHTTTGNFLETNPVNHQDPTVKATQCVTCHVDGNTTEPVGRSSSHPKTSNQCQDCHQAGGSFLTAFDHTLLNPGGSAAGTACMTCHDGTTATGKPVNHVPTSRDCLSCHAGYPPTVNTFANGTFDHTGPEMTGKQCMDCHDGVIATGKTPTHIVTSADCGACHTTTTFANATSFDHTGVTSGCANSGCHNEGNPSVTDVTDDPNPLPHIPIKNNGQEVDCYNCHKSPGGTFANAVMNHAVVTFEGCENCHDGKHDGSNSAHVATAQSSGHIVSKTASGNITTCATCHTSTSDWTQVKYKHSTSGHYPGDHSTRRVTTCTQCHTDTNPVLYEITTFDNSSYTPYCAVCHLSQYRSGHGGTPDSKHVDCGKSGCHNVGASSFD